ncbi:Wrky transcription factor [Thalictrum thalictroides]|uniref:Wrky transcription factor n=1 Tax=Thalictrum thalictroides TaxID=46969 RepID=A0A7J6VWK1_THATH|nr:Wrky transcription factor [Thalictrum thalictroides]
MAITENNPGTRWFDESDDELIRELLDNDSPLFVLPQTSEKEKNLSSGPITDHLVSKVHSETTTEDFESELSSITSRSDELTAQSNTFQSRIAILEERLMGKIDNKYTLKIKSCGNEISDDGYKWRKYGQKSIKNSPHPRSYYRCTNPRCSAKKQVERSSQEPETLIVTYEGLHLHFMYTHFLLNQSHLTYPPTKKAKTITTQGQTQQILEIEEAQTQQNQETEEDQTQEVPTLFDPIPSSAPMVDNLQDLWEVRSEGLLEDMVPLMIRRPQDTTTLSNPSSACSSSYPSSPLTSSSSSLNWSPNISSIYGNGITSSTP